MPKAKIKPRKTVKKRGRPEEVRLKIAGDPAEAIAKFLAAKETVVDQLEIEGRRRRLGLGCLASTT